MTRSNTTSIAIGNCKRNSSSVDLKDCLTVNRVIQELLGANSRYEVTSLRLRDIAQRAESKLENLEIPCCERPGAKCAFRPEGAWVKSSQFGAAFQTLLISRGRDRWYLEVDEFYEGPRCRGEVLLLTTAQRKRAVAELDRKFRVIEKPRYYCFPVAFDMEVRRG